MQSKKKQYHSKFIVASLVVLIILLLFISPNRCVQKANALAYAVITYPLVPEAAYYHSSYPILNQGDSAQMNVTLIIDYTPLNCIPPEEVVIKWVGLQFDWMSTAEWIQKDLSSPTTLEHLSPSDMIDFGKFEFQVPSNTMAGNHTFTIRIRYDMLWNMPIDYIETTENETSIEVPTLKTIKVWTYNILLSKYYNVEVHSIKEKQYYELTHCL